MFRRSIVILFVLMALQSNLAQTTMAAEIASGITDGARTQLVPEFFKSGVKFDPQSHQWLDRYNNQPMDLGLPGVAEKFGKNSVISAVTNANTTTTATSATTTAGGVAWKKIFIATGVGLGIATAIAVPIACGVHARHHHHHVNNNKQANQLATYYYFHNQTLPVPKLVLPPPPPVEFSKPKPPPKVIANLFRF